MKEEFVDDIIIRTLSFWAKRTKNGCSREEKEAFIQAVSSQYETWATIQEIAEYYGKSKDAVYGVIKRKYIGKPRRNVVMYSLTEFDKIVPKNWRVSNSKSKT